MVIIQGKNWIKGDWCGGSRQLALCAVPAAASFGGLRFFFGVRLAIAAFSQPVHATTRGNRSPCPYRLAWKRALVTHTYTKSGDCSPQSKGSPSLVALPDCNRV